MVGPARPNETREFRGQSEHVPSGMHVPQGPDNSIIAAFPRDRWYVVYLRSRLHTDGGMHTRFSDKIMKCCVSTGWRRKVEERLNKKVGRWRGGRDR